MQRDTKLHLQRVPRSMNCQWQIVEEMDNRYRIRCQNCRAERVVPDPTAYNRRCQAGDSNGVDITEAAGKLGLSLQKAYSFAKALARWTAAGFPVREQSEVERIEADICKPCEQYSDGRCKKCGCRVNGSRIAIRNKIRMMTEDCPLKKWVAAKPATKPTTCCGCF